MEIKGVIMANVLIIILLTSLYIYSINLHPEKIEIGDVKNHIGEYVSVRGIVSKVENTSSGTFLIIDDMGRENSTVVFLFFHPFIAPGYMVEVSGVVQIYSDSPEITVKSPKDIRVLSESYAITLHDLLSNPQSFINFRVKIYGNITDIQKDWHYIEVTDGIHTTWVYVERGYEGEEKAYFSGIVKNGMLHVENVSLKKNASISSVSIDKISNYEGKEVEIFGKILNYGSYGYITDGKYSLRAFFKGEVENEEDVYVEGLFIYDENIGAYEIICG